ncbi:AsmA family protein, partial [Kaarinaea lacus]
EVNNKNGKLDAELKKLHSVEGGFSGELSIDASGDDPLVTMDFKIPQLNMAKVLGRTDAKGLAQGNVAFEVSLQSQGKSAAQLAAASQGRVRILVQEGEIEAALLKFLIGGMHAMFSMVVTADAKTTKVNCGIAGLNVENGVITPEIAVLDTEYSTIVTSGSIDLNTETVDLRISPLAKGKTKLNMAVPVTIKGNLAAPTVIPQAGRYLIKAGEIFAMFAMPSLAMFAAYDSLAGETPNPCLQLVNPKSNQLSMGAVSGAGQAVKDVSGFFLGTINKVFGVDLDEDAMDMEKILK